jgi:hypothetical protein
MNMLRKHEHEREYKANTNMNVKNQQRSKIRIFSVFIELFMNFCLLIKFCDIVFLFVEMSRNLETNFCEIRVRFC